MRSLPEGLEVSEAPCATVLSVAGLLVILERFLAGGGFILRGREASLLPQDPSLFNNPDRTADGLTTSGADGAHTVVRGGCVQAGYTYPGYIGRHIYQVVHPPRYTGRHTARYTGRHTARYIQPGTHREACPVHTGRHARYTQGGIPASLQRGSPASLQRGSPASLRKRETSAQRGSQPP